MSSQLYSLGWKNSVLNSVLLLFVLAWRIVSCCFLRNMKRMAKLSFIHDFDTIDSWLIILSFFSLFFFLSVFPSIYFSFSPVFRIMFLHYFIPLQPRLFHLLWNSGGKGERGKGKGGLNFSSLFLWWFLILPLILSRPCMLW